MITGFKCRLYSLTIFLSLFVFILSPVAVAQLSINNPASGGESVASAPDYATEVLNQPWDMNSIDDLAEFIAVADYGTGLTNYTQYNFSGGLFRFAIDSADGAFFHLLSPGQSSTNPLGKNGQALPIDSTRYRYLLIRMNTDTASEMRIHWNTGTNYASNYVRTDTIVTTAGWRTYVIDLETIGKNSNSNETRGWSEAQNITGLRIEPGFAGNVQIDWVRLVGDAPDDYTINYSFTAAGNNTLYSLFLDSDTDPFNGYEQKLVAGSSSGSSYSFDPTQAYPKEMNVIGFAHDDYSLLEGDPWDMDNSADVFQTSGVSNEGFSGGGFSGTTNVRGAWVSLNTFGGAIDTDKYRYLTIAMTVNGDGFTRVRWYPEGVTDDGSYLDQYNTTVGDGLQVVKIDLESVGNWSGNVGTLRIYPKYESGTTFNIHYVALQANGYSDSEPSATIVEAPGELTVNDPPRVTVLQPDPKGGVDFATEVQGNPWNMDKIQDVQRVYNLKEAWIYPNNFLNGRQGDFFCGTVKNSSDDPIQMSVYLHQRDDDSLKIDASRFKNLSFDAYVAREQDVVNGSVLRVIAWNLGRDSKQLLGDDTIIQFKGSEWFSLTQDMTKLQLEELVHPDGSYPVPFWTGLFERFQVDIHEFTGADTTYCIDKINLRADDESNTRFALTYDVSDSDSADSDVEIAWYYNTSESTSGGTLITDGLTLADDTRVYLWDTSGIAAGTYWVYAVVTDGANTISKMGHRLVINHDRSQDETVPELSISSPSNGSEVFQTLRLKGWAIDNVQVALVEVLVDGNLLHTFVPSRFDKTARDSHPTFPDASSAGFLENISVSSLSNGNHTVLVRVYDTAGNSTTSSFDVSKSSGSDVDVDDDPAVNEERIPVTLDGKTTQIDLRVRLNKRKRLFKAIISNAQNCSDLKLIGAADEELVRNTPNLSTIFEAPSKRKTKLILKGRKVKGIKPNAANNRGRVVFGLMCNGHLESVRSIKMSKIKRPRSRTMEEYLPYLVGKIK